MKKKNNDGMDKQKYGWTNRRIIKWIDGEMAHRYMDRKTDGLANE